MQQAHLEQTVEQSYSFNATPTPITLISRMDYTCSKITRNDINVAIIIEAKMEKNMDQACAQVIYK